MGAEDAKALLQADVPVEQSEPARASAWCSRPSLTGSLLRVPGFAREHAEIDADLLQRPLVFAVGVLAED